MTQLRGAVAAIDDAAVIEQNIAAHGTPPARDLLYDFNLTFRTLDEATDLAIFLATFFPRSRKVVVGISELLINAVEHGNLGIGYQEKTELANQGRWQDEVGRRQALPEYADRRVHVGYRRQADCIILTIADEGQGFDWQRYQDLPADLSLESHGRGIAIARLFSFDSVEYHSPGNVVTCQVKL